MQSQKEKTVESYKDFVTDSETDLAQTVEELASLEKMLEKERRVTNGLQHEKKLNDEELGRLGSEYNSLTKELNALTFAFDQKQSELDELRK